jgi:LmbE family N-acetylglucosaminyl deacetylase
MEQPEAYKFDWTSSRCAVIVAHPDDETLWAGGTMLLHPEAKWTVITLCRKSDPDRAPMFFRAIENLGASGRMGDLDDGPDQLPLNERQVRETIMELLACDRFDLIISHGPRGEYTRHLRHEETGTAVVTLWKNDQLHARRIWRFAYSDDGGEHLPQFVRDADRITRLPDEIWQQKYEIVTDIYGFTSDSFEARTTPRTEAFWCFEQNSTIRAER